MAEILKYHVIGHVCWLQLPLEKSIRVVGVIPAYTAKDAIAQAELLFRDYDWLSTRYDIPKQHDVDRVIIRGIHPFDEGLCTLSCEPLHVTTWIT